MSLENLRRTPLIDEHIRLKGKLVPFVGWELPIQYRGISAEHQAVRQKAGLFDVSHMGQLELKGPQAAEICNRLITNDLNRLVDGQAVYTCCCNEQGMILDDLIVYKRSVADVMVVCNASNRPKIAAHFAKHTAGVCDFRDASDDYALIALQGPRAFDVLAAAGCNFDAKALGSFHFKSGQVASVPCTIARTGYTGEDGVEIFTAPRDAAALWRNLIEAGQKHGIEPAGLGARDTLRLEARLSLYGNEIDETTNPLEAGLGWTVKFDKSDFLGRAALEQVKKQGLSRSIVGFEMTGRGVARHGYPLLNAAGQTVGVCTSGGPSPTLEKSIGLGYLPKEMSSIGTEFLVDCRGQKVSAVVIKTPFYKRPNQ